VGGGGGLGGGRGGGGGGGWMVVGWLEEGGGLWRPAPAPPTGACGAGAAVLCCVVFGFGVLWKRGGWVCLLGGWKKGEGCGGLPPPPALEHLGQGQLCCVCVVFGLVWCVGGLCSWF
jgi:hypothetical protein